MEQQTMTSLVLVGIAAVCAPLLAEALKRFRIPSVVLEIGLGIVIGPQVLGWASPDGTIGTFANLGLAFLMFLAGYEIDMARIRGRPLNLALAGWACSLVLAFAFAFALVSSGLALSTLLIGLALTTTALGTLLPILRDSGLIDTRFGSYVMGVGTVGEFGPIVAIALLLTGSNPAGTAVLLVVFVGIAAGAGFLMLRSKPTRFNRVVTANLHSSSQLPVRVAMLLVLLLIWVASRLGLDVLLGAFAAGMIVRLITAGPDEHEISHRLEAIGFGFLVPIFFVVSGIRFDLDALTSDPSTAIRLPLFLGAFLFVRGLPVLLYRRDLDRRQLLPLALFSAVELPLVVVITSIGTETGRMLPSNAAALVGAGMLSVLLFPALGAGLLRRAPTEVATPDGSPGAPPDESPDESPDRSPGAAAARSVPGEPDDPVASDESL